MKYLNHLRFALTGICFIFLTVLGLFAARPTQAACYPPDDLGTCGSGVQCQSNSLCADNLSECSQCFSKSLSCNWAIINNPQAQYNEQPGFCVGGFDTPDQANNYRLSFNCQFAPDLCGILTQSQFSQNLSNKSIPGPFIQDDKGKYYTCVSGPFLSAVNSMITGWFGTQNIATAQCLLGGVAIGTALLATPVGLLTTGAQLLTGIVFKTVGTAAVTSACVPIVRKLSTFAPTLTAQVVGLNGAPVCSGNLSLKFDQLTQQVVPNSPLPGSGAGLGTTDICNFVDANNREACAKCFAIPGVYTPFGCIETNPQQFIGKILRIAIGIAGGIAFLMIIYGGFVIMTSAGNPEHLTNGKEIITSAISGLLLIIFSVVILKIVGVDILNIPGFGG